MTISRKSLSHYDQTKTLTAKPNKNLKLYLKHLVFPGTRCFTFATNPDLVIVVTIILNLFQDLREITIDTNRS